MSHFVIDCPLQEAECPLLVAINNDSLQLKQFFFAKSNGRKSPYLNKAPVEIAYQQA